MKRSPNSRSNGGKPLGGQFSGQLRGQETGSSGGLELASAVTERQDPTNILLVEPLPPVETLLCVTLRVSAPGMPGETVPQEAKGMVDDLLTASGGHLRDAPAGEFCASYFEAESAVRAARHLRLLIEGFAHSAGVPLLATSVLMHADEAASQTAVAQLRSGENEIVLVGALAQAARRVPGLDLQQGANDNLVHLLPAAAEAKASATLTRSVQTSPKESTSLKSSPGRAVSAMRRSASSFTRNLAPVPENETPAQRRWPLILGGGVAAAALVVAAGLLLHTATTTSAPASNPYSKVPNPRVPDPVVRSPATPPAPQPEPARPTGIEPPTSPKIVAPSADPPIPTAKPDRKTTAHDPARTPAADVTKPDPKPSERDGISFSSADLEALVQHADLDAGNGRYEQAITKYNIVLKHDPKNSAARRGLERAKHNQDQQ